jgi:glycosyltransferase involved in cell wall biosynthesis
VNKIQKKVVIYDPNWINPYGVELSAVIAGSGYSVDLWCTENRFSGPSGVKLRPRLALGRRTRTGLVALAVRRLIGPLAVFGSSLGRSPLIVVWTRDPWDAFVFVVRALLGGKTIFIYHNPSSVRKRPGFAGLMERQLLRASNLCVVHSARLAAATAASPPRIRVAAHPPYSETTLRSSGHATRSISQAGALPVVAFVGGLREDKGAKDFVQIAAGSNTRWILRVLGPDRISDTTMSVLKENGVTCEHVGSGTGPSDAELISGLETADVMIAPYRSVTESGSIHMALSLRVPVLAYASPGVEHIVNSRSMAPSSEEFGQLLSRYLAEPWPTYTATARNLHQKCEQDWNEILNESY